MQRGDPALAVGSPEAAKQGGGLCLAARATAGSAYSAPDRFRHGRNGPRVADSQVHETADDPEALRRTQPDRGAGER